MQLVLAVSLGQLAGVVFEAVVHLPIRVNSVASFALELDLETTAGQEIDSDLHLNPVVQRPILPALDNEGVLKDDFRCVGCRELILVKILSADDRLLTELSIIWSVEFSEAAVELADILDAILALAISLVVSDALLCKCKILDHQLLSDKWLLAVYLPCFTVTFIRYDNSFLEELVDY